MVNISNNHILDYYEDGLLDTTAALRANNLAYVGAGKNEDEAYQLKVADIKGNKVGFMSFCHFSQILVGLPMKILLGLLMVMI